MWVIFGKGEKLRLNKHAIILEIEIDKKINIFHKKYLLNI